MNREKQEKEVMEYLERHLGPYFRAYKDTIYIIVIEIMQRYDLFDIEDMPRKEKKK